MIKTLFFIVAVSLGLVLYRLSELMPLIGDQGWFYISARDMVLTGNIPLVGIASSHPWIHQGALWTYLLAIMLWVFSFNPISGAYLSIFLHIITILLIYGFGFRMFSNRVGIIAAFLYATSPLIIFHARMPYHTSPIPLITLVFFYSLHKWVEGNIRYFPFIILSLVLLYNFELATFVLFFVFFAVLIFGIWKQKKWLQEIFNTRIILYSLVAFLLPMLPMLIYDFTHGFPQTFKFLAWIGYKILVFFGYSPLHPEIPSPDIKTVVLFIGMYYKKLIYLSNGFIAFLIAIFSFGFFYKKLYSQFVKKKFHTPDVLLAVIFIISFFGIVATKTTSEAYLPLLFPIVIFITALFFDSLFKLRPRLRIFIYLLLAVISIANINTLLSTNYMIGEGKGYIDKVEIAKKIISESQGRNYIIIGKGEGSQFESFTMPYEYLTWWLGHPPTKDKYELKFYIIEDSKNIIIKKDI